MDYLSSQSTTESLVRLGEVLAGKYRVDRVLGRGAMGVVLAATHTELQQEVAIKVMLGNANQDPTLAERFRREARVSARIRSEHVARVMDVGKLDCGVPFIVMELLQGCDLGVELAERGPLPLQEVADYLLQASDALAEAHAFGIVHRDLKPSNFFLMQRHDGTRVLKLLDFGISKMIDADASEAILTATHALMGSPLYMAPEQIRNSKDVDTRSDVWSLGIILYELLAGKPPFERQEIGGVLAAIMTDTYPSIRSLNPNVPEEVEALIDRCLQKDRDQRLSHVVELASGLKPFASSAGQVIADRISRLSLHTVVQIPARELNRDSIQVRMQTSFGAAFTRSSGKSSALPWLGSAAVVALAVIALAFWFRSTASETPASSPASHATHTASIEHMPAGPSGVDSAQSPQAEKSIDVVPSVAIEQLPIKEVTPATPASKVGAVRPKRSKAKTRTRPANDEASVIAPAVSASVGSEPAPAPSVDPLSGRK